MSSNYITGYKYKTTSSSWPSRMHVSGLQTLWVFLSLLDAVYGQQDGIQTIFGDPTYSKLRLCAKGCFYVQGGNPATSLRDVLGSHIGCPMVRTTSITSLQVAENNCFCRAHLQLSAQGVITQCVMSRCDQNANGAATTGAMYSGYCSANGYYAAAEEAERLLLLRVHRCQRRPRRRQVRLLPVVPAHLRDYRGRLQQALCREQNPPLSYSVPFPW